MQFPANDSFIGGNLILSIVTKSGNWDVTLSLKGFIERIEKVKKGLTYFDYKKQ